MADSGPPLFSKLKQLSLIVDKRIPACKDALYTSRKPNFASEESAYATLECVLQETKDFVDVTGTLHQQTAELAEQFHANYSRVETSINDAGLKLSSYSHLLQKYGFQSQLAQEFEDIHADQEGKENIRPDHLETTPKLKELLSTKYRQHLEASHQLIQSVKPEEPTRPEERFPRPELTNPVAHPNPVLPSPKKTTISCTPTVFKNLGIAVTPGLFSKKQLMYTEAKHVDKMTPLAKLHEVSDEGTPEEPELTSTKLCYTSMFFNKYTMNEEMSLGLECQNKLRTPEEPFLPSLHKSLPLQFKSPTPPSQSSNLDISDELPPSPQLPQSPELISRRIIFLNN